MTPTTIHFDPLTLIPVPADWPAAGERAWGRAFEPEAGENSETRFALQELLFLGCQPGDTFRPRRLATVRGILALEDQMLVAELLGARLIFQRSATYPAMSVRGFLKWAARTRAELAPRLIEDAQEVLLEQLGVWWHQGRRPVHFPAPYDRDPSPFQVLLARRYPDYAALPPPAELGVFLQSMILAVPWLGALRHVRGADLIKQARLCLEEAERFHAPALDLPWRAPAWPGHLPILSVRDVLARLGGL